MKSRSHRRELRAHSARIIHNRPVESVHARGGQAIYLSRRAATCDEDKPVANGSATTAPPRGDRRTHALCQTLLQRPCARL